MASNTHTAPERMHALDAVRGLALLLGIAFHAAFSFVPSKVPIWVVTDNHPSVTLGILFFSLHVFRMTTFFMIAGFFAHMTFHRRGARDFILDRLKRIAVPLVVGWPFLFASIVAISIWAVIAANHGVLPKGPSPAFPRFPNFPLTHLWFLYVLLEFYAGTLIVRGVTALIDRDGRFRAGVDRVVASVMGSPFAPLILAAPTAVLFALSDKWLMWFGIPTPDGSFATNAIALTGFGTAFGFGWLLHRQTGLLEQIQRRWALNLALGVAFIAASLAIVGVTARITPLADETAHLMGAVSYALATWTMTFAMVGLALRFLSGYSPVRRYIADASYWLYLIHMPIVMALQVVVAPLDWPWPLKYAVILGVGLPSMLASYELLVRHSFIGWVLNGRRAPWRPVLQTQARSSTPVASVTEASR
jgi:glucan biosynthesis protein C